MIRLLFGDLVAHLWSWLGPAIVIAVTAFLLTGGAAFFETGAREGPLAAQTLVTTGSFLAAGATAAALLVIPGTARLAISLQRRTYALWMLAGFPPRAVASIVSWQFVVVGVVGSSVGAVIGSGVVPRFLEWMLAFQMASDTDLHLVFGPAALLGVIGATTLIAVTAAVPAARDAGRTPPLAVLREPVTTPTRMTPIRWIVLAALLLGAGGVLSGMLSGERATIVGLGMLLPLVLAVAIALVGPQIYPRVVLAWTAVVPASLSVSWYLARHSARYRIGHSAAVISPLMIAIAVLSSFAAVLTEATASVALTQDDSVGYYGLDRPLLLLSMATLIIGGPLVLALTGTAVTAFVAGPNRARGTAALVAAGATGRQIVTASVWEAIIHVVTAALLGTAITSTVAVATAASFALQGVPVAVVVPLGWVAAPAAAGAGLILLATVLPTLATLTRSVRQELGVD